MLGFKIKVESFRWDSKVVRKWELDFRRGSTFRMRLVPWMKPWAKGVNRSHEETMSSKLLKKDLYLIHFGLESTNRDFPGCQQSIKLVIMILNCQVMMPGNHTFDYYFTIHLSLFSTVWLVLPLRKANQIRNRIL